jgi:hypothetical protein
MRQPKYPLETLAQVRKIATDVAIRRLAGAVRERDAASKARQEADDARLAHDRSASRVLAAERNELEQGGLRVVDLARAETWGLRVASERARLSARIEHARANEAEATEGQRVAQDETARRRGEADVVAKDRARWENSRRKSSQAREEEAASEAWRPKR